jgi:hypothetical protein
MVFLAIRNVEASRKNTMGYCSARTVGDRLHAHWLTEASMRYTLFPAFEHAVPVMVGCLLLASLSAAQIGGVRIKGQVTDTLRGGAPRSHGHRDRAKSASTGNRRRLRTFRVEGASAGRLCSDS